MAAKGVFPFVHFQVKQLLCITSSLLKVLKTMKQSKKKKIASFTAQQQVAIPDIRGLERNYQLTTSIHITLMSYIYIYID